MDNSKYDMSFIAFIILNVAVSLILIIVDSRTLFGATIMAITIFIAVIKYITLKQEQNALLTSLAKIVPYFPFSISITSINNEKIASNQSLDITQESMPLNCILVKSDSTNLHNMIVTTSDNKQYLSQKNEILDDLRNIVGYVQLNVDITEIMRHQESLIHYHAKVMSEEGRNIADLIDNNGDGIIVFAYNSTRKTILRCLDFNDSMKYMSGLNAEQLYHISMTDLFYAGERDRVNNIISNMTANKPILFETLMINKQDCFSVEIKAHLCKVYNQGALFLSIRNTQMRRQEESMRDINRMLVVRQYQNRILTNVLHVLIARISSAASEIYAQTKNIDELTFEAKNYTSEINAQIQLIMNILQELILFYTPNNIKTQVNLKSLLDKIISTLFFKAMINNISITIIQKDEVSYVYCHEDILRYIFVTLLNHIIETINRNKGTNFYGIIDITLEERHDFVLVSFLDNGGGLDADIIERVFDIFYTTQWKSMGIGLPTCRILVEKFLFGTISVSNTSKGSIFNINISK